MIFVLAVVKVATRDVIALRRLVTAVRSLDSDRYWFKKVANQKGPYQKGRKPKRPHKGSFEIVNDMYGSYICSRSLLFPVSEDAAEML